MSEPMVLSPSVVGLLNDAGARFLQTPEDEIRIVFSDVGLLLTTEDSGPVIMRWERGESPTPVLRAASIADLERYLVWDAGRIARRRLGLNRIRLPWKLGQEAAGSTLLDRGEGWFVLEVAGPAEAPRRIELLTSGGDDAVRFSHVASVPVEELVASYRDADGKPALEPFVLDSP